MIRVTTQISRAVNRYRDDYRNLYNEIENARNDIKRKKKKNPHGMGFKNSWITISEDAQKEYLQMVEKYLIVTKFPNSNRKVVLTTHDGGKFAGFYENGKWWYNTLDNAIEVDAHVIKWEENYF